MRETAWSRAALFGTTAAVPNLVVLLLQRSVTFTFSSTDLDKIIRLYLINFPSQDKTFPEELNAGCSCPSHKCCVCPGLDDPRLIQSVSTTGNSKFHDPLVM